METFSRTLTWQYHDTHIVKMARIVSATWFGRSLYVWSWFFGRPVSKNYLKDLGVSPFLAYIVSGTFEISKSEKKIILEDGLPRKILYLLAEGIY